VVFFFAVFISTYSFANACPAFNASTGMPAGTSPSSFNPAPQANLANCHVPSSQTFQSPFGTWRFEHNCTLDVCAGCPGFAFWGNTFDDSDIHDWGSSATELCSTIQGWLGLDTCVSHGACFVRNTAALNAITSENPMGTARLHWNQCVVLLSNPDNCATFFQYYNGVWHPQVCPPGLYFCPENAVCTWNWDPECTFNCIMP